MSTPNQFQKFSPGWMTTKKRGRDDDQIAKDGVFAKESRKKVTNRGVSGPKWKLTKRNQCRQSDLDDFLVEDDVIETISSSDSEDIEIIGVVKSVKGSTASTEESSCDSPSEDIQTLLKSFPRRTSRPSAPLQASSSTKRQTRKLKKKPVKQLLSSSDESGSEESVPFVPARRRKKSGREKKDEEVDDETKGSTFVRPKYTKRKCNLSDTSDDDFGTEGAPSYAAKNGTLSTKDKKSAREECQKKLPSYRKTKYSTFKSCKQKRTEPPQDEVAAHTKPTQPRVRSQDLTSFNDDFMDDDEAEALAWALRESQKEHDNRESGMEHSAGADVGDSDDALVESDVDEYVSSQGQQAKSVLDAANDLSARVIQTMANWSEQQGSDATKGMIVDGALTVFNYDERKPSKSWISMDEMRMVCPSVKLADYQLVGVNWLALLHGMRVEVGNGTMTNVNGVLADSMGLGKTVQTIAFLAWLRNQNLSRRAKKGNRTKVADTTSERGKEEDDISSRPHLIVVPASVLSNWMREFEKFCPEMRIVKYHGTQAERVAIRAELQRYLQKHWADAAPDAILTTYSYFSCEKADDRSFLRKFAFDYMIVDEAHCLKNPQGSRYKNMDRFKTSHRLLLTGTPVQNSPKELMSLLCFLMPLFSRSSVGADWDDDGGGNDGGEKMLRHFVSLEGGDGTFDDTAYRKLKQLFAPFVLRRRKDDVLHQILPPKTRKVEFVPFDASTRLVYDSILATHIQKRENGAMASLSAQKHLFTALRKAANHPLLLRTRHQSEEAIEHLVCQLLSYGYFGRDKSCTKKLVKSELESFSDFDIHWVALEMMEEDAGRRGQMERYRLSEEHLFSSPKFDRLRVLIPNLLKDGHRILIFSQWTRCLDLLGCLMESLDLGFLRLDGQTPIVDRQKLIDKFNNDPSIPIFLLSTRAGGMGINLTAADTCILHDLDFNPFNDLQAEDRCHRIGQTKPVTVIKMVTENTVDSDIYEMQQRKARMNAAILENTGKAGTDKKEDEDEVKKMLQKTVDRYLRNPGKPGGKVLV